jgi:GNAT superfamily N-acetyltransferase
MVKIERITENKKEYLDLLLLADEQENMIDRYLPNGNMFTLYDDDLKSVCVLVPVNDETCELKNIATYEKYQGKGYGRALINFIFDFYKNDYQAMVPVFEWEICTKGFKKETTHVPELGICLLSLQQ